MSCVAGYDIPGSPVPGVGVLSIDASDNATMARRQVLCAVMGAGMLVLEQESNNGLACATRSMQHAAAGIYR